MRCGLQARSAARFGVMVGDVKVDFGKVMQRMRELRAKRSANDSAKRFAGMGVDVYQVWHHSMQVPSKAGCLVFVRASRSMPISSVQCKHSIICSDSV